MYKLKTGVYGVHLVWNVVVTDYTNCIHITIDREESDEKKDKRITMKQ